MSEEVIDINKKYLTDEVFTRRFGGGVNLGKFYKYIIISRYLIDREDDV